MQTPGSGGEPAAHHNGEPAELSAGTTSQDAATILVVDDNEAHRYFVRRVLAQAGFVVREARTGSEALARAAEAPDVVVLDIRLPDIDGLEVCRRLKRDPLTAHVPVMHLSASFVSSEDRSHGIESGADGYLVHPVEPRELVAHVRALVRVRRAEDARRDLLLREQAARTRLEALVAELESAKTAAETANRAKDDFLAAISHELRTPLTPLLMMASTLEKDASLPAHVRSDLAVIRRHAELEARLIDDLLDLTRIARGKLSLEVCGVDMHLAIASAIDVCRADLEAKGLHLHLELGAKKPRIRGDVVRLQQVLWNLLKNAIKFTPAGGHVTVRTSDEDAAIRVSIIDTGIGIAPELLPRLFSTFEQGGPAITRRFGGLGLSLAISSAIVALHHGTLGAESAGPGLGATFTIVLPSTAAVEAGLAAPASPPVDRKPPTKLRILLVEDHEVTSETMARVLRAWGHTVFTASSVRDAMALAAHNEFDVLLSDLGLPDGSGLDVMRSLKDRDVIGICLSGFGMEEDLRRSREAGFSTHLTKPVSVDMLRAVISQTR